MKKNEPNRGIQRQTVPLPRRGKWAGMRAEQINDFRPGIDLVKRDRDGRAWVIDGQGHYAPVEVAGDTMPANYADDLDKLPKGQVGRFYEAVRRSPYLSAEGKAERLSVLRPYVSFTFTIQP